MKSPFRVALALWLSPDFAPVLAGKMEPPRVNHSRVNFDALVQLLAATFHYGPPVTIRVPNDTIDQVTLHLRNNRMQGASLHCEDFGAVLLQCAKQQKGAVIDVRKAWHTYHALSDRDFAPPPILLPFVIEAADFEDAMIWCSSAKPPLGLPFLSPQMQVMIGETPDSREVGVLPDSLKSGLATIFGCPFENSALLDRMAMDTPPAEYRV